MRRMRTECGPALRNTGGARISGSSGCKKGFRDIFGKRAGRMTRLQEKAKARMPSASPVAESVFWARLFSFLVYLSVGLKAGCGAFDVGNLVKIRTERVAVPGSAFRLEPDGAGDGAEHPRIWRLFRLSGYAQSDRRLIASRDGRNTGKLCV